MTKTAHTDLAGAIGVAKERLDDIKRKLSAQRMLTARRKALKAEADALTLIIASVRGYEAMLNYADEYTVNYYGKGEIRKYANSGRILARRFNGPIDVKSEHTNPLAAFRAVAKEGDE
jgi:hypothetical protein